jgi:N-acyl-D-aspartate/D-glutamate deacylase
MYDLILEHTHIVDGTGKPGYTADIIIEDGRIHTITEPGQVGGDARKVIDAAGRLVTLASSTLVPISTAS